MRRAIVELKELTQKVISIFGVDDVNDLSNKIYEIVMSDKKAIVFDEYIEAVGDLKIDYLQKIYQHFQADRKTNKQDFTPSCLSKLVSEMTNRENEKMVYDCCAGSGSLTIEKWNSNNNIDFVCEELDEKVIPFLLFNLAIRNINAIVLNGNVLTGEIFKKYLVKKGNKYSDIFIESEALQLNKADSGISNPPYNISWQAPTNTEALCDERFSKCIVPPKSNANYAFILHILNFLNDNGKMSMILPNGVLTSGVKEEYEIRQYLIDNDFLESVVILPDKMFQITTIATCIFTLNKNKKSKGNIVFIDARQTFEIEVREQKGELHTKNRTYTKEYKILNESHISDIVSAVNENINKPGFSKTVNSQKVVENDYNISPSRFIDFAEKEEHFRPYNEIVSDINKIIREKNVIKISVNEGIAKLLGLCEIYELIKSGNQNSCELEKFLKNIGCSSIIKESFLTLTKNKNEVKIENQDKEIMSSLMSIFMPMWRQHIYFLNQQENIYLAELRDALLPDLMSGKLVIESEEVTT